MCHDPGRLIPAYTLDIAYPVDYPDEQAVVDYVKQTRDGFLNVAKMPGSRDMPYEMDTTATEYNSAVPPRGTQSVVFKTYQNVGGAHPQTFYKSFNWDQGLAQAHHVRQPVPRGHRAVPGDLADGAGRAGRSSRASRWRSRPAAGLDPTKYQNFAITDDALIFFFSQGEMMPESAGALAGDRPAGPRRRDDRLTGHAGAKPYT